MLELLHAVITSLLLSAAMGGGADQTAASDEDPAGSETGVDVGTMPAHLAPTRGQAPSQADAGDDHQPASLAEHTSFCEPRLYADRVIASAHAPLQAALFPTAGRSP